MWYLLVHSGTAYVPSKFRIISQPPKIAQIPSQNYRKVKGPPAYIWSTGPAQARPFRVHFPGPGPDSFWINSKDGDFITSQRNLCQCSVTLTVKKCFLVLRKNLPFFFVPIASVPVTGYHWKEPVSVFFAPSLQVLVHVDEIPLSLLQTE